MTVDRELPIAPATADSRVAAPAADHGSLLADASARLFASGRGADAEGLEERSLDADLDADGEPEVLVSVTALAGATGNEVLLVYLSNGGSALFAGELFGEAITVLETRHAGVLDLATYADGGCASMAGSYEVHVFDGTEYRSDPTQSVDCDCPATEADEACSRRPDACPCRE